MKKNVPGTVVFTFFLFTIGIMVLGVHYYRSQKTRIYKENQETLAAITSLKLGQLKQWRNERIGDADVISKSSPIIRIIKEYFRDNKNLNVKGELKTWMESLIFSYDYSGVSILDTLLNTRLTVYNYDSVGIKDIEKDLVLALRDNRICMTDLHRSNRSAKPSMNLIIPITDSNGKELKPLGIVILRMDPGKIIFPLIQLWPTPSKTAETLIIRKEGDSVLYLNNLRHKENSSMNLKLPVADTNLPASKAANGFTGIVEGIDYRKVPVVGYVTSIKDFNWFIVAKIDKAELEAPLKMFFVISAFVTVLLILIVASVLGYFVWDHNIKLNHLKRKDAEALRESEMKFKQLYFTISGIIESSRGSIFSVDTNYCYTSFNKVHTQLMKALYGVEIEPGKSILDCLTNEADRKMAKVNIDRALTGEFVEESAWSGTDPDKRRYFEVTHNPICNENNEIIGIAVSARDLTDRKRIEEKLVETEELFSKLFHNMLNGFAYCRMIYNNGLASDFIYLAVNEAFETHTGLKNVIGKRVSEVIPGIQKSDPELLERYGRVALSGNPEVFETYVESLKMWFSISVYSPHKEYFVAVFDVITERKKTEKALAESEDRFRSMYENISIGMYRTSVDGQILMANPSLVQMMGFDSFDQLSKRNLEKEGYEPGYPRSRFHETLEKFGRISGLESAWTRNDGSIFYIRESASAKRDNNGKILYYDGTVEDITEHKKAEELLRESERRLREAQEMAHLGFWFWDIKTGYVEWSEEVYKIFWLDPEKFTPQIDSILALSPWEEDNQRDKELINRAIASHTPGSYEQKFLRPDKSVGHYYSTFQGNYDEQGNVVSIVGTVLDITERKISEFQIKRLNEELELRVIQRTEQLEAANKELEAFSYSVSHDLRAPLRAIHGYTNILLEEYSNKLDEEGKRLFGIVYSSASQMGELIDDLLNFSRIGRSSMTSSLIDMKSLAMSVVDELKRKTDNKELKINISRLNNANGDPALIKQVWINLISNALKYSSKKEISEIFIGSSNRGEMITYHVRDNGVGFDMLYKHKLFGVFQRLHTGKEFEGNGVGLAIVQRIILRHGGKVWAEGEIDKGATFYFSLPLKEEDKRQKYKDKSI